uniref:GrpE protein n=1 Tax=Candidatus Kentrum sp. DK TaxID=2126562 RepID=A0A450RUM9_9GAMM|nr:MAG: GrpE protein [Candidatus Kentron sp. DK]
MSKQRLNQKLVAFQRTIIDLERTLDEEKKHASAREDAIFLGLFSVLDSFENIFHNIAEKEQTLDKTGRRMLKSFRATHRKLMRLLEEHGVKQIQFPDGEAIVGLSRIIETKPQAGRREGEILAIVRNGYQSGQRVLRPAEVITVGYQNHESV